MDTSEICLPRFFIEMLNLIFSFNLLLSSLLSFGFGSGDIADNIKRIVFIWWQKGIDINILHKIYLLIFVYYVNLIIQSLNQIKWLSLLKELIYAVSLYQSVFTMFSANSSRFLELQLWVTAILHSSKSCVPPKKAELRPLFFILPLKLRLLSVSHTIRSSST